MNKQDKHCTGQISRLWWRHMPSADMRATKDRQVSWSVLAKMQTGRLCIWWIKGLYIRERKGKSRLRKFFFSPFCWSILLLWLQPPPPKKKNNDHAWRTKSRYFKAFKSIKTLTSSPFSVVIYQQQTLNIFPFIFFYFRIFPGLHSLLILILIDLWFIYIQLQNIWRCVHVSETHFLTYTYWCHSPL